MFTNKTTHEIVDHNQRLSRRQLFWKLYSLPWVILTIILLLIIFYQYKTNYGLNGSLVVSEDIVIEKSFEESEDLNQSSVDTSLSFNLPISFPVVHLPQSIADSYVNSNELKIVYTNESSYLRDGMALVDIDELNNFYIDAHRFNGLGEIYDRFISFEDVYTGKLSNLNDILDRLEDIHGMYVRGSSVDLSPRSPFGTRSDYPRYDLGDHYFAESIGYDVEKEIINSLDVSIYRAISNWDGHNKGDLSVLLHDELEGVVIRSFDGFETYNKIKGKRGMR